MLKYCIFLLSILYITNIKCENPIIYEDIVYLDYGKQMWLFKNNSDTNFINWNTDNTNLVIYNNNMIFAKINNIYEFDNQINLLNNNSDQIILIKKINAACSLLDSKICDDQFLYRIYGADGEELIYTKRFTPYDLVFHFKDYYTNENIIKIKQTYKNEDNKIFNKSGTMTVEFLNNNNHVTKYENRYIMLSVLTYHLIKNSSNIISYNIYLYFIIFLFYFIKN